MLFDVQQWGRGEDDREGWNTVATIGGIGRKAADAYAAALCYDREWRVVETTEATAACGGPGCDRMNEGATMDQKPGGGLDVGGLEQEFREALGDPGAGGLRLAGMVMRMAMSSAYWAGRHAERRGTIQVLEDQNEILTIALTTRQDTSPAPPQEEDQDDWAPDDRVGSPEALSALGQLHEETRGDLRATAAKLDELFETVGKMWSRMRTIGKACGMGDDLA